MKTFVLTIKVPYEQAPTNAIADASRHLNQIATSALAVGAVNEMKVGDKMPVTGNERYMLTRTA